MYLAISSCAALLLAVQSPPAPTAGPDPAQLTLDQLIQRLPVVGIESAWNKQSREFDHDPIAREFTNRLDAGAHLTDSQWRDALVRAGAVRWHEKWPKGEPFALSIQTPEWLHNSQIILRSDLPGLGTAKGEGLLASWCGTCSSRSERRALYQEVGALEPGLRCLEFRVEILTAPPEQQVRKQADQKPSIRWQGSLALAVDVVETLDAAMPPVSNEAIDRAVRASLGVAFSDWGNERSAILVLDPDFSVHPELADVALSLEVAILHGEEVVETKSLRASDYDRFEIGSSVSKARAKSIAFAAIAAIPVELEADDGRRDGWHLRVTGKSDGVLRNWSATRRFGGQFDLPLDEAIRADRERAGPKARRPWGWIPGPR